MSVDVECGMLGVDACVGVGCLSLLKVADWAPFKSLIIVAGGLSLGVEKAGPVLALEPLLEVPVDEHLDGLALGAHGEGGDLFGGREVAQDEGAEDGGEGAPVAHDLTRLEGEGRLVQRAHDGAALAQAAVF